MDYLCFCLKVSFLHFDIWLNALLLQTVAMKFILKHGKSEKDIQNLRQEIEVLPSYSLSIL